MSRMLDTVNVKGWPSSLHRDGKGSWDDHTTSAPRLGGQSVGTDFLGVSVKRDRRWQQPHSGAQHALKDGAPPAAPEHASETRRGRTDRDWADGRPDLRGSTALRCSALQPASAEARFRRGGPQGLFHGELLGGGPRRARGHATASRGCFQLDFLLVLRLCQAFYCKRCAMRQLTNVNVRIRA